MSNFFYRGTLILLLFATNACVIPSTEKDSNIPLNSNKIALEDTRAKEKKLKSNHPINEIVPVLKLDKYEAITSYTEVVKGKLNTVVNIAKESEVRLSVIGSKGQLVSSYSRKSPMGLNDYLLDFSNLSVGHYYVTLVFNNEYRRFNVAKTR